MEQHIEYQRDYHYYNNNNFISTHCITPLHITGKGAPPIRVTL